MCVVPTRDEKTPRLITNNTSNILYVDQTTTTTRGPTDDLTHGFLGGPLVSVTAAIAATAARTLDIIRSLLGHYTIFARILHGRCCDKSNMTRFKYATRSETCRMSLLFVSMAVTLSSAGGQSLGKCPQMDTMKTFNAKQASKRIRLLGGCQYRSGRESLKSRDSRFLGSG